MLNLGTSVDDFLVKISNKQLNFVQHVITLLKIGGTSAIVVPDNVLFESSGKKIREYLLKSCNLHTILRLPHGTFQPYTGVKANVIFFTKGNSTKETWVYDLRTNTDNINKSNPLTKEHFKNFEKCYSQKTRKEEERFKKYPLSDIEKLDYNLDIFWLKDKSTDDSELPEPEVLANNAKKHLKDASDSINQITNILKEVE